ncbi:protein of unknown function [Magnetospirillum sp. XM-1]|nr:protein of unknown function [Magnetospirillum sp. XM-1]
MYCRSVEAETKLPIMELALSGTHITLDATVTQPRPVLGSAKHLETSSRSEREDSPSQKSTTF